VRVNTIIGSNTVTKERYFSLRKRMTAIGDIDTLEMWAVGDNPSITAVAVRALKTFIEHKATIIIAGGTGSGKTTFLRGCIKAIPADERIVTIEDSSELVLTHEDYAPLVAHGEVHIEQLMENAMRMVPKRIILGECRKSAEVGGFLEAINTGHDGSITTTHASSAEDALYRLLTLAASSARAGSSENFVGRQIASGVDLVVFINSTTNSETKDEHRVVAEIVAVESFSGDGGPHFMLLPMFGRWSDPNNPDSLPEMDAPLRCAGSGRVRGRRFWRHMRSQGISDEELMRLLPTETLDADADSAERR
jgi:Flp pilus assembly CpaF family ATPase